MCLPSPKAPTVPPVAPTPPPPPMAAPLTPVADQTNDPNNLRASRRKLRIDSAINAAETGGNGLRIPK